MFWNIEVVQPKRAGVTEGTWGEKEFDRFTLLCNQDVDAQTVEIALFACNVASPVFTLIDFRALDALIVADRDWVAVDHIDRFFVEFLPGLT